MKMQVGLFSGSPTHNLGNMFLYCSSADSGFFFFFYLERCPEIILKEKFSFCSCSVPQLCLTLCNPVDCSTPGFPVLHYLPVFV